MIEYVTNENNKIELLAIPGGKSSSEIGEIRTNYSKLVSQSLSKDTDFVVPYRGLIVLSYNNEWTINGIPVKGIISTSTNEYRYEFIEAIVNKGDIVRFSNSQSTSPNSRLIALIPLEAGN